LSLDLLSIAELNQIKTSHQHFIQATSSVKKRLKPLLMQTFKEVLALESPDQAGDSLQAVLGLLADLARARRLGSLLGGNILIESFVICAAYLSTTSEIQADLSRTLASVWVSQGDKVFEGVYQNFSYILDLVIKGNSMPTQHKRLQLKNGKENGKDEDRQQQHKNSQEQSAREKLEEVCFDRSTRLTYEGQNFVPKFGYCSQKILPFIVQVMIDCLPILQLDSGAIDIDPILATIKKIKSIRLEDVAYSPELVILRTKLQSLALTLGVELSKYFKGTFQDLFSILFEDFTWKTEPVESQNAFLKVLIDLFLDFPLTYHVTVSLEDPNLVHFLPKYLSLPAESTQQDRTHRHLLMTYLLKVLQEADNFKESLPTSQLARLAGVGQTLTSMSKLVLSLSQEEKELYASLTLLTISLGGKQLEESVEDSLAFRQTLRTLGVGVLAKKEEGKEFLGKRRDWQDYFHTLFQDTRAKTLRKAREVEGGAEHDINTEGMNQELNPNSNQNMHSAANSKQFSQFASSQFNGSSQHANTGDIWDLPKQTSHERISTNDLTQNPFEKPKGQLIEKIAKESDQREPVLSSIPKKQLFDSDEEEQSTSQLKPSKPSGIQNKKRLTNGKAINDYEEMEEKPKPRNVDLPPGSPSMSIDFSGLEQAPHFSL
jgi:hypothetical protein